MKLSNDSKDAAGTVKNLCPDVLALSHLWNAENKNQVTELCDVDEVCQHLWWSVDSNK
jgi:hypothetical protein